MGPFDDVPEISDYVQITGRRELGQSLAEIAFAMLNYQYYIEPLSYAAAASPYGGAVATYVPPPPLEEVVVRAPRDADAAPAPPSPPPRPPVVAPAPVLPPTFVPGVGGGLPAVEPSEAFLAPMPTVVVRAPPVRAPVPTPAPARVPLGPLALLAGLIPTYLSFLGDVDEAATQRASDRLGLPPRGRGRGGGLNNPELPPDPYRYGRPDPWNVTGPPLADWDDVGRQRARPNVPRAAPAPVGGVVDEPLGDLDEVVVTGSAPRVFFDTPFWLQPTPIPGLGYDFPPLRAPEENPQPVGAPQRVPQPIPSPGLYVGLLPDAPASPFPEAVPSPATRPLPAPAPRPVPIPPTLPDFAIGQPGLIPLPGLQPQPSASAPPRNADPCDCSGSKSKSNKKKKPRTVCYRGTYTERATGLSKRRRVRVSCKTGKTL